MADEYTSQTQLCQRRQTTSEKKKKINQLCIADCLEYFMGSCMNDSYGLNFSVPLCLNCKPAMRQLDCSHFNQQCRLRHNTCSLIIMGAIQATYQFVYFYYDLKLSCVLCWCSKYTLMSIKPHSYYCPMHQCIIMMFIICVLQFCHLSF